MKKVDEDDGVMIKLETKSCLQSVTTSGLGAFKGRFVAIVTKHKYILKSKVQTKTTSVFMFWWIQKVKRVER